MSRMPRWCDLECRHASFPGKDALDGACHTFIALWCEKYRRLVQKSALCLGMTRGAAGNGPPDVTERETEDG